MALYYFDIQIGNAPRSIDEEGEEFSDLDSASTEAGLALCSLARDDRCEVCGKVMKSWNGSKIYGFTLKKALEPSQRPNQLGKSCDGAEA